MKGPGITKCFSDLQKYIDENLDKRNHVFILFIDLSKEFRSLSRSIVK